METPFGITREEVLGLAAAKLAEDYADTEHVSELAGKLIRERIEHLFDTTLKQRVDAMLAAQMEKILGEEICPVDIYGQRTGKPTTIRAIMADRAKVFWTEKVDSDGRFSSYGGKERCEWLFAKIVNEEFNKAVKQNITNLVGAFKDAVSANAAQITKEHIDSLIKVKSLGDR